MIQLSLLHVLAGAFALFALTRVVLRARERRLTWGEMLLWAMVWAAMIVVIFVPEASTSLAGYLGIGRGIDLVMYAAIVLLFYLLFRLYVRMEQIEHEVTLTVREVALKGLPGEGMKQEKKARKEQA